MYLFLVSSRFIWSANALNDTLFLIATLLQALSLYLSLLQSWTYYRLSRTWATIVLLLQYNDRLITATADACSPFVPFSTVCVAIPRRVPLCGKLRVTLFSELRRSFRLLLIMKSATISRNAFLSFAYVSFVHSFSPFFLFFSWNISWKFFKLARIKFRLHYVICVIKLCYSRFFTR